MPVVTTVVVSLLRRRSQRRGPQSALPHAHQCAAQHRHHLGRGEPFPPAAGLHLRHLVAHGRQEVGLQRGQNLAQVLLHAAARTRVLNF